MEVRLEMARERASLTNTFLSFIQTSNIFFELRCCNGPGEISRLKNADILAIKLPINYFRRGSGLPVHLAYPQNSVNEVLGA
jgi:hypothetical protein